MPRSRQPRRRLRWVLALIGAAVVVVAAYTAYQAVQARSALRSVAADVTTLRSQLASSDSGAVQLTLAHTQVHARTAYDDTRGPVWWVGAHLPWIGNDVTAVRTVASGSNQLAQRVLPQLVRLGHQLRPSALRPEHGRIPLAPFQSAVPQLSLVSADLAALAQPILDVRPEGLIPAVRGPLVGLQTKLADAVTVVDRVQAAARLLPGMLGIDGPRTYLMIFQNNAEIRTTGGIPGAYAVLHADHGRVRMGQQGSAQGIGFDPHPVLPLSPGERALFSTRMVTYPQDVNFTPDFPRSARILQALWARSHHGQRIDGVLSADPVALSEMLAGTGPVRLASGQRLDAANAVSLLLNQVYLTQRDQAQQNAYFAGAARRVFTSALSGAGNPQGVLDALVRAASQRRLMIWSAHPREQQILASTPIAGRLPTGADGQLYLGVYFNDSGADKLDYYLHPRIDVRTLSCDSAGVQQLGVHVSLTSRVPRTAPLSASVIGPPQQAKPPRAIRTTVLLYAPVGGRVGRVRIDGRPAPIARASHDGRPVVAVTADVLPGQSRTLTYSVTSGPGQRGDPQLRVTPGAHGSGVGHVDHSAC